MLKPFIIIAILFFITNESMFSQVEKQRAIDSLIDYGSKLSSSNHLKAIKFIDSALELSKKFSYPKGEAEALRKKGLALFYAINYNEALQLFLESKEKFEKINDQYGVANANNMIAIVYAYHGRNEKALELHKENLILREKIKDTIGISTSLNNIGVELRHLNKFNEALFYYRKAIEIEIFENDLITISRYYDNMGSVFLKLSQLDSAFFYINKALAIRKKIDDRQGIKNCLESLGDYYSYIGDYTSAKKYQEQSLEIAYEIGIVYEIESITSDLGHTYAKLGDYKKAYDILVINRKMQDSLKSKETTELLNNLEIQKAIASEKKIQQLLIEKSATEKKIQLDKEKDMKVNYFGSVFILSGIILFTLYHLRINKKHNRILLEKQEEIISQRDEIVAQNESISSQNEILVQLNSEKDKFFSIIAHDLKSPFSGFLNLTKTLAEEYELFSSEDIREYSRDMQDSASNLYKLLENLLEWSRIQRGVMEFNTEACDLRLLAIQNINIQTEVAKHKKIELINNINSDTIITADIPMLNTVFRNLISNAIKFTTRGGKIEIGTTLEASAGSTKIYIKDSGIGMDKKIIDKLFRIDQKVSRPGTEDEPSTGLGLLLCKEFVEKHGGKIWVESEEGKGSTFYFSIPKS